MSPLELYSIQRSGKAPAGSRMGCMLWGERNKGVVRFSLDQVCVSGREERLPLGSGKQPLCSI